MPNSDSSLQQNAGTSTLTRVTSYTNLQDAVSAASQRLIRDVSIHRTFIIGGASLYRTVLVPHASSSSTNNLSPQADRILITRILYPPFADCDTFFPEFRELKLSDGRPAWKQASHEELETWVGCDVPRGTQTEKEVEYEFQMWLRNV